MSVTVSAVVLALLLGIAAIRDIQTRRIPNGLCAAGLGAGLLGHLWHGGGPGLLWSLAGVAATLPLLVPYTAGALGAGDVKLLMAVGALAGPVFLLRTLLGALFAGGLLALAWLLLRRTRHTGRMPFAPAIAAGAAWAFVSLPRPLL